MDPTSIVSLAKMSKEGIAMKNRSKLLSKTTDHTRKLSD